MPRRGVMWSFFFYLQKSLHFIFLSLLIQKNNNISFYFVILERKKQNNLKSHSGCREICIKLRDVLRR